MPRTKSSRQPTEGRLAAIYARVSDKSQAEDDKTSIGEQIAEMEAYCENIGLTITARYQEIGHGWSKMRSEFQRMLADARAGRFDTIVCWKSDRLSRGMYPAAALMEVVEAYQMRLEAVTDSIDIRTFGRMAAIRMIELDNFRERASVDGYRRGERGKPEIEENEAEIVRRIFQQCAYEGMGGKLIANQLMADGVPPRKSGTYWHASSIIRLIRNQVYKDGIWWYGKNRHLLTENGRRVHRQPEDAWIAISFPPLVDETTWERAQEATALRVDRAKRNTKVFYMLQHLVRRTECGMLFGGRATRQRTIRRGDKVYQYDIEPPHRYYRCYGDRKSPRVCREHSYIRAERLEELVWSEVKRVVQQPDVIIAGIEFLRTEDDGQFEEKAAQVEKDLRSVQTEEDRLIRVYVVGKISEAQLDRQRKFITGRVEGLRAKLGEHRLYREKAVEARDIERRVSQWAEAVGVGLGAISPEERREVLLLVLDRVTIDGDDRVGITLSIPMQELEAIEKPGSSYWLPNSDTHSATRGRWNCTALRGRGSSPLKWAGLDEIKNRRALMGPPVGGHGDGVREGGLIAHHLDALHEVAYQGLPLQERPLLQEGTEICHVIFDLLGPRQIHPALLQLALSFVLRCRQLIRALRLRMRGDSASRVNWLVSRAS